jgi:hypothetical protein
MAALPVRALYTIAELATAAGRTRWQIERVLGRAGVRWVSAGRARFVSLADLEMRVRPLWEGIKAAEMLRHAADE